MKTLAAVGALVIFAVLTAVILKHQATEIPVRDVNTSLFLITWSLVVSGGAALVKRKQQRSTATTTRHDDHHHLGRPPEYTRTSNQLMKLEVLLTLVLPWMLLKSSGLIQHHLHLPKGMVEHLLVPHLYFFQAQILGESVLFATHQDDLVFFYTCMANALRGLPIGTWLLRSLVALQDIQLYNPFHWLLVAGLPIACTALWIYSSLIFIPLIWYPVTRQESGGHQY